MTAQRGPVKAGDLTLSKRMTVAQGFQAIALDCLNQIKANATGVAAGVEPEYVHQMRIGLRRLDTLLSLFGANVVLPLSLLEELDWLAAQLSAARDWHVLAQTTLPPIALNAPADLNLTPLQHAVAERVASGVEKASAAVQSLRYRRLIPVLSDYLETGIWQARTRSLRLSPLAPCAAESLLHARARLLKRAKKLRHADAHRRHRLRIAAKKLRYAIEFFQSLIPPKRRQRWLSALSGLQDELGRHNDTAVAHVLLRELAHGQPRLAMGIGFVRGCLLATSAAPLAAALWLTHSALRQHGAARQ